MKYLKTYETNDFKINDFVICINDVDFYERLKLNKIYKVLDVAKRQIKLENPQNWFHKDRFRLATSKEIKEYNIKKEYNKYNL